MAELGAVAMSSDNIITIICLVLMASEAEDEACFELYCHFHFHCD
jgi:hypothetical protein